MNSKWTSLRLRPAVGRSSDEGEQLSKRAFPEGFSWGVATAGHQVEGDNRTSDTWLAEQVTPTVFSEPSGRACDSYARWAEDVDLAANLGLTAYRFSVEWARVEPAEGQFDQEALAHYEAIVDRCRDRGLAPIVTYNHFTCPGWFAAKGSWLSPDAAANFARYCRLITERFGSKIALAVTLNEPNLARLLTWIGLPDFVAVLDRQTIEGCRVASGSADYRLANVVLPEDSDALMDGMEAGHRAGRAAIKAVCPNLPVGLSVAVMDDQVQGPDASIRDRKRADLYQRWLELAREDDFVGIQNYETVVFDADGIVPPPADAPRTGLGSAIAPRSLYGAVTYAYAIAGVPVLVTEHGLEHADDRLRVAFIPEAIAGLRDAMDEGVPVIGYTHWSLLDNFEWIFGYTKFYGLHAVDRQTFERTAKPSAAVYGAIARANAI